MDITGIGSVADLANNVINKIWPDKSEQEKQEIAGAFALMQSQIAVDQAEASNPTLFVSGWRPFIGWTCGSACAWNWIGIPIVNMVLTFTSLHVTLAQADTSTMMPILMGLLGLGGLRTVEKINGVAAR